LLSDLAKEAHRQTFDLNSELERFQAQCGELVKTVDFYREKSLSDPLTGLSIRQALFEFLNETCKEVVAGNTSLMVLFMDIDNFKDVNDQYGHASGDRLLLDFSRMLNGLFGEVGCVARYGGDEFVVALAGLDLRQAEQLSKGLLERTRRFSLPTDPKHATDNFSFSCSIGMVFYAPGSAPGRAEAILIQADRQMYEVKNSHKNDLHYEVVNATQAASSVIQ
jgi:diguanylate cyclase (GGDEF)-like protein